MKEFSLHINSLIQKHDCVIIPDFGGFVLRRDVAKIADDGAIIPPQVSVGFNPDLKYNDGLLAESYMNMYSISYDIACKKIGDVVYRLNTILGLRQPAPIGNLGTLILDEEKRLSFIPNSEFSLYHPETFGLDTLEIKKLADIEVSRKVEIVANRKNLYQRIVVSVGAAAAAVAVFFVTSTPIYEPKESQMQKSGFFTDIITSSQSAKKISQSEIAHNALSSVDVVEPSENALSESISGNDPENLNKNEIKSVSDVSNNASLNNKGQDNNKNLSAAKTIAVENAVKTNSHLYYVIIGSASSKTEAKRLLLQLKSQGYRSASVLESKERPRIYISVFEDKGQAEQYAANFRRNNPKLNDAWIYSKRN